MNGGHHMIKHKELIYAVPKWHVNQ